MAKKLSGFVRHPDNIALGFRAVIDEGMLPMVVVSRGRWQACSFQPVKEGPLFTQDDDARAIAFIKLALYVEQEHLS